jgi:hypothetical protein
MGALDETSPISEGSPNEAAGAPFEAGDRQQRAQNGAPADASEVAAQPPPVAAESPQYAAPAGDAADRTQIGDSTAHGQTPSEPTHAAHQDGDPGSSDPQ